MPNILSIDVGTVSLGFAIYDPQARQLLAWGVKQVGQEHSSYMRSVVAFEEECIERQLRHLNYQMGRLEANLEGYFYGKGKRVLLLPAGMKYDSHGLQLPSYILTKFQN